MTTVKDIRTKIENYYSKDLAYPWDNPGLIAGRNDKRVKKVYIALDATSSAIEKAIENGADMIITHHPMLFDAIKQVNDETAAGKKLISLISHDISYYAMHTNFDVAEKGMSDIVSKKLGVKAIAPLDYKETINSVDVGIGFYADLNGYMYVNELAELLKEKFNLSHVVAYDTGKMVRRIAVCPGSGRHMLEYVKSCNADAFIAGDMTHHDGLDYLDEGISLLDAGHFGTEHIFVDFMAAFMKDNFTQLEIITDLKDERLLF